MVNLNQEVYNKIVSDVIEKGLNPFDARNELYGILNDYQVNKVENDPARYDLKFNIEKFLREKKRTGLSPLTLESYTLQTKI